MDKLGKILKHIVNLDKIEKHWANFFQVNLSLYESAKFNARKLSLFVL